MDETLTDYLRLEAFIRIPVQYEEYETKRKICKDHMSFSGRGNFCQICGAELTEIKETQKRALYVEDITGNKHFYAYFEDATMYLFSNLYDCGINTDESMFSVISPEIISKKIKFFKEKHKEDIKALEEKLQTKIVVEFGFLYHVH